MIRIETARLFVREFTPADVAALYALTSDPRVMTTVGDGNTLSYERTERWITRAIQDYKTRGWSTYATIDKSGQSLVGWCGYVPIDQSNEIEMVYAFAPEYWGHGLATEIARALLDYGFQSLALPRIWATIDAGNAASIRVAQKYGMRLIKSDVDEHGLPTDFYVIEKAEWLTQ